MENPETWLGVLAIAITTAGAVVMKWINRGRPEVQLYEPADLDGADLTTIAGIATVVSRQSLKISALEAKTAAQGRYQRVLVAALLRAGVPVPDPDPEDEPLIRG
ncbi:hypothetical protein SAMN05216251_108207 [Actinacidiphila alni]|uniref:Uncharacterized protein n=1 Tax=Actinacidiphila alni TaxID=380248 RepID=A0A1I2G3Q7_9ACTN|nr:hypothetical protein [Actinacidiphila alni]SFF11261.1 hypothetical protein SAMN05216251_108207 [Actinacidiphila alni]